MTGNYFRAVRRDKGAAIARVAGIADIDIRKEGGQNLLHGAIAYAN